jgi:hypothetical protein
MKKLALGVVLVAFAALSIPAVLRHGYVGLFEYQFQSLAGLQVLADLGIALSLVLTWLWRDARANARNPYLWIVLTLALGSFGPLLYLLSARSEKDKRHLVASGTALRS